jgi:hypothetical protein
VRPIVIISLILLFGVIKASAQTVEITGKITATGEVDGIHIINKTASRFSISNSNGHFIIPAKLNDTILFSGISYQPKEIVVTKLIISSKQMLVYLEELVTALDEVVVGKVLTGDLTFDLNNAELKRDLDFYDLGIPGYTGKLKTQTERRLYEATSGGGLIPVGLIINAITGRTKRLKEFVKLEKLDNCLDKITSDLSELFFSTHDLEEEHRVEFFYFCQDDPTFENLCKIKNHMSTLVFLETKLKAYKLILQTLKD